MKDLQASTSRKRCPNSGVVAPLSARGALAGPVSMFGHCVALARKCLAPGERKLELATQSTFFFYFFLNGEAIKKKTYLME